VASALTLASFAVVTAAIAAAIGRVSGGASVQTPSASLLSPPSTESPSAGAAKGTAIGLARDVPLGGAREFTDPAQGIPAYVVRPSENSYVGFSAVCTHMGCTVAFFQPAQQFRCPCHGSIFSAVTGEVLQGPAAAPLPSIPIEKATNGTLLAGG
jgi:Rieske Fe-S protein